MKNSKFLRLVLVCLFLGSTMISYSQKRSGQIPTAPVQVGSLTISVAAGVGTEYRGDYYYSPFGTKVVAEWGLWHAGPGAITLGGELGGSFSSGGYYDNYETRTIVVAARSAWHYGWKVKGLDTYGGLSMGLGFHHYEYRNDIVYEKNEVIPVLGIFAGVSYFVSPSFGFNAEAGHDITNFQIGVIFKAK